MAIIPLNQDVRYEMIVQLSTRVISWDPSNLFQVDALKL